MSLAKALLVSGRPPVFIEAQFNPKELSQSFTGHIQPHAGADPERLEWTGPTESELKLTLFFDGLERGINVRRTHVMPLSNLLDTGQRPPELVRFVWGYVVLVGAIVNLEVKYTMFLPCGDPCRAEVSMTLRRGHSIEPIMDGRRGLPYEYTAQDRQTDEWLARRQRG